MVAGGKVAGTSRKRARQTRPSEVRSAATRAVSGPCLGGDESSRRELSNGGCGSTEFVPMKKIRRVNVRAPVVKRESLRKMNSHPILNHAWLLRICYRRQNYKHTTPLPIAVLWTF